MPVEIAPAASADGTDPSFWNGTRATLTAATGLAPAAYAGIGFFAVEQERVFGRAWVCVGTIDEARAGRLLVRQVGGRSVIICRDADGRLHGFLNSCRHRGTELADVDCDVAGTIRCPYHRWGYALDGRLTATPLFDDALRDDFDRNDHGLVAVRIDTWGALVFACLSDDTPPLGEWLGDLPDRMAGYDLDRWTMCHQQTVDIAANWKLISENFQECYHLAWVHPELAKVSRVADHYRYQGPGMYCGQTTTPVSGDERNDWLTLPAAPGLDDSDSVSGRFVAIFPNVLLSVLPNHVWLMRLDPVTPGMTRETCTMLLPPVGDFSGEADAAVDAVVGADDGSTGSAIAATRSFWLDVNTEDIDIVQRSQRGLQRGAVPPGPLAPRFEEPLHRFHNMLADHMLGADVVVPPGDSKKLGDDHGARVNPAPPRIEAGALPTKP